MALRTLNIELDRIENEAFNRCDVKFYFVQEFFKRLSTQQQIRIVPLGDLVRSIVSGSYVDTYTKEDKGIPYLRVSDIKAFSFDENSEDLAYVSPSVPEKIKIKENDILVARTQATTDKLGTASFADKRIAGYAVSQHTTRICVDERKISPFYLVAYLNSNFFKAQTALASHGDTRVELTHSQLHQVRVFIPDGKILEDIEKKVKEIVGIHRKALILIEEAKHEFRNEFKLKQKAEREKYFSVEVSALMGFDIWNPTCHLPFYAETEKELMRTCKTITLGEVAHIDKGNEPGSENYEVYLRKNPNDFAFIRTSDIINHEIDLFPDYFISREIVDLFDQDLRQGDILFTKDGKIGQTAMITEYDKAIVASGVAKLRPKAEVVKQFGITPEYLFICLSNRETGFYPAIRRTIIGATIPHLKEDRLKQIPIPVAKKDTIKSITEKISVAFKLKAKRKVLIRTVLSQIDNEYEKFVSTVIG